jgi:hypothetical protein
MTEGTVTYCNKCEDHVDRMTAMTQHNKNI